MREREGNSSVPFHSSLRKAWTGHRENMKRGKNKSPQCPPASDHLAAPAAASARAPAHRTGVREWKSTRCPYLPDPFLGPSLNASATPPLVPSQPTAVFLFLGFPQVWKQAEAFPT